MSRYRRSRLSAAVINLFVLGVSAPSAGHAQTSDADPTLSESSAFHRSLWGTALPLAAGIALAGTDATDPDGHYATLLILAGITVGPSLGHWYAGDGRRATRHALVRAAIVGGTVVGLLATCDYCLEEDETLPLVVAGGGMLALLVHASYDIVTAPASVRRARSAISVSPWVPGDDRGLGFRATLRF